MKYWAILIIIVSLFSCQHLEYDKKKNDNLESSLESRAAAFWEAWLSKDWETLFGMFDPLTRKDYEPHIRSLTETAKVEYLDYKIVSTRINAPAALVEYQLTIKFLHPMIAGLLEPHAETFFDFWLERGGVWYKVYGYPELKTNY
jgi:hypothetical protein